MPSIADAKSIYGRPVLRRFAHWILRRSDWLAMPVLLAAGVPVKFLVFGEPVAIPHANFVDDSWIVDIVYKAARGVWLGRDVIFTYGCLYQALISWPVRILGFSLGAARVLPEYALMWTVIVLTFATSRLLLNAEPAWKRAVFLILIVSFFGAFWTFTVRTAAVVFLFVMFLTCAERVSAGRWPLPTTSCLIGSSLVAAFLLSADTGFYSVIAFGCVFVVGALLNFRKRRAQALLKVGIASAAVFIGCGLIVNIFLGGGILRFRFLQDSLALVSSYRWLEASAMSGQDARIFALTAVSGLAVMLMAWFWQDPACEALTRRPLFLLSAPLFAVTLLQTGLVRSDWYHIAVALYPTTFLALAILFGTGGIGGMRSTLLVLLAIGLVNILAGPTGTFKANVILDSYRRARNPICSRDGLVYLDRACFGPPEGQVLSETARYLQQQTTTSDALVIYPYENLFGDAAGREVAGGVLQNYLVGGSYLVQRQLRGLEIQKPSRGLYFVDRPEVWRIDGISNFTRTPDIWLFLQSHYRAETETAPGVFTLVRDEEKAGRVQQQRVAIPEFQWTLQVRKDRKFFSLGLLNLPKDADFLKLTMRVRYSVWWKLRKPSRVSLFLTYTDGSRRQYDVVVQPNTDCEVWLYPWDEQELWRFFSSRELDWHGGERPQVLSSELYVEQHDAISMLPRTISILKAEAVRLTEKAGSNLN